MARGGRWASVWVGGYKLTTSTNAIGDIAKTFDEIPRDGYQQDHRWLLGMAEGGFSFDCYLDTSTIAALQTPGSNTADEVGVALGNNAAPAIGQPMACMSGVQPNYTVGSPRDGTQAVNAAFKQVEVLDWGVLLADEETVSANGNTATSVDNAASSADGGVGYLFITGISAGDTITVTVEDSPNDSTWATLGTFTLDGSALAAERITVAGTVDRYLRVAWTVTGASIDFDIAIMFKRS